MKNTTARASGSLRPIKAPLPWWEKAWKASEWKLRKGGAHKCEEGAGSMRSQEQESCEDSLCKRHLAYTKEWKTKKRKRGLSKMFTKHSFSKRGCEFEFWKAFLFWPKGCFGQTQRKNVSSSLPKAPFWQTNLVRVATSIVSIFQGKEIQLISQKRIQLQEFGRWTMR